MAKRKIGNISLTEQSESVRFLRRIFQQHGIHLARNRILYQQLTATDKFVRGIRDIAVPADPNEFDDIAIRIARDPLRTFRLAESIAVACRVRPACLHERLLDLSRYKRGSTQHWDQYLAAEYELYCAADFANTGTKLNFIHSKTKTRFVSNVEFLLRHKWPVECKRPLTDRTVCSNVRSAVAKIVARDKPGIICVALDDALSLPRGYLQVLKKSDTESTLKSHFDTFWTKQGSDILQAVSGSPVCAILFHAAVVTLSVDDEDVGYSVVRVTASRDGTLTWDSPDVKCVTLLEAS